MIHISVQLRIEKPYHSGAGVYLDIDGDYCPKLSFDINSYARIRGTFDTKAAEFAYFCAVIYGCDRAIKRDNGDGDRWTREISVNIPVADPEIWSDCTAIAEEMLEFLTGDLWHLTFYCTPLSLFGKTFKRTRRAFRIKQRVQGSSVSLFSGGLDSLIGVIDWLEENPDEQLMLASTYDAHAENAKNDQERVLPYLRAAYPNRLHRFVARSGIREKGNDLNFRSRSLTFLGNAILAASFVGDGTEICIPENGAIALNFPLTPARQGSLSTRTVHPNFLRLFNLLLGSLNFSCHVINPYELKTKGEMMRECLDQDLLQRVYGASVSCGKRGFGKIHWHNKSALACGHCVPCIFRQAAVVAAGFSPEEFGCDVQDRNEWGSTDLLKSNGDLQSVIDFVNADHQSAAIWRILRANGRLNVEDKTLYVNLVTRLRTELRSWLANVGMI